MSRITITAYCLFLILNLFAQQEVTVGAGSYNLGTPVEGIPGLGGLFAPYPIGNGNTAVITRTANYPGPFQTQNWWNSALWDVDRDNSAQITANGYSPHSNQRAPMQPHPFQLMCIDQGIALHYRTMDFNVDANRSYNYLAAGGGAKVGDVVIGIQGSSAPRTEVDDYGDWHVKLAQNFNGTTLYTTSSIGSPFMYFEVDGSGTPEISAFSNDQVTPFNVIGVRANVLYLSATNGLDNIEKYYALSLPGGTTVNGTGIAGINSGTSLNGITLSGASQFTLGLMPDGSEAAMDLFEFTGYAVITDTRYTYNYEPELAKLTNTFTISTSTFGGQTNQGTLTAFYRHQYLHSPQASANNTGFTYASPRGPMQLVTLPDGIFQVELTNNGVLPHLGKASNMDEATIMGILEGEVLVDAQFQDYVGARLDDYNHFQRMEKAARGAEIAHQLGRYDVRDELLDYTKEVIEDFLHSPNADINNAGQLTFSTCYGPDFNWLATYPNSFFSDRGIHDQHFVLGHLVYAAAIVARFEQKRHGNDNWISDWKPMVDLIIRNIDDYRRDMTPPANPNTEPWFPYLRFFDPYVGHSWAHNYSGSQESISESLNFAAGTWLWGEVTGDNDIRDLGAMLFITESESGRQYWFDVDDTGVNSSLPSPNGSGYDFRHAGVVYNDGSLYGVNFNTPCPDFYGGDIGNKYAPFQIHGITYWPISGASIWMGANDEGAMREWQELTANGPVQFRNCEIYWQMLVTCFRGLVEPVEAREDFENHILNDPYYEFYSDNPGADSNSTVESMLRRVNGYHWITTLDSVGRVYSDVQADHGMYAVFQKDYCDDNWIRHYMVYNNPNNPEKTVTFTDGTCWTVPSDTNVVFKLYGPNEPGQTTVSVTDPICIGDPFQVSFNGMTICRPGEPSFWVQVSTDQVEWNTVYQVQTGDDSLSFDMTLTQPGTYYIRQVMVIEAGSEPGLACDLITEPDPSRYAQVSIENCGCPSPTFVNLNAVSSSACEGESITVNATSDANEGAIYVWFVQGDDTPLDSSTNVTYNATVSGDYYVRVYDPLDLNCYLNSQNLTLTFYPAHELSLDLISDKDTICVGELVQWDAQNISIEDSFALSWYVGGDIINGFGDVALSTDTLTQTTTVSVVLTSDKQCLLNEQDSVSKEVVVFPVDEILVDLLADLDSICAGESVYFYDSNYVNDDDAVFNWYINDLLIVGDGDFYLSIDTLTVGSEIKLEVETSNRCVQGNGSDSVAIHVDSLWNMEMIMDPDDTTICPNSQLVLWPRLIPQDQLDFIWIVGGDTVINGGFNPQITPDTLTQSTVIQLSVVPSYQCAVPDTLIELVNVTVLPAQEPNVLLNADKLSICPNELVNFTASTSISDGITYHWFYDDQDLGQSDSSLILDTITQSVRVSVVIEVAGDCVFPASDTAFVAIDVTNDEIPDVQITPSDVAICANTELTLNATPISGGGVEPLFLWLVNGDTVVNPATPSSTLTIDSLTQFTTVTVVMISDLECVQQDSVDAEAIIDIIEGELPSFELSSDLNSICPEQEVTLIIGNVIGGGDAPQYTWFVNGNEVATNVTTLRIDTLTQTTLVSVTLLSNSPCRIQDDSTKTLTIQVQEYLEPSFVVTPSINPVCLGENVDFTLNDMVNFGSDPQINWFVNGIDQNNNGITWSSSNLTDGDTVLVSVLGSGDCSSPLPVTFDTIISVTEGGTLEATIARSDNGACVGVMGVFSIQSVTDGASYSWYHNGIEVNGQLDEVVIGPLNDGDSVYLQLSTLNTCVSPMDTISNVIYLDLQAVPLPTINIAAAIDTICQGEEVEVSVTLTEIPNPQLYWYYNDQEVLTSNDLAPVIFDTLSSSGWVRTFVDVNSICYDADQIGDSVWIEVHPMDTISATLSRTDTNLCEGEAGTFVLSNVNPDDAGIQWFHNNVEVANDIDIISLPVNNNDLIYVQLKSKQVCLLDTLFNTDTITVEMETVQLLTGEIDLSQNAICANDEISVTLQNLNPDINATIQWLLNGQPIIAGEQWDVDTLTQNTLLNVEITSEDICVQPDTLTLASTISVTKGEDLVAAIIQLDTINCDSSNARFRALNAVDGSEFYWLLNGDTVAIEESEVELGPMNNGDEVQLLVSTSVPCVDPGFLYSEVIAIEGLLPVVDPEVSFFPDVAAVDLCAIEEDSMLTVNVSPDNFEHTISWFLNGELLLENASAFNVFGLEKDDLVFATVASDYVCLEAPLLVEFELIITAQNCDSLFIPNAFTPNGDGEHDVFDILNTKAYSTYHLEIFNRWGQLVFESSSTDSDWDGKRNGKMLPQATYYYVLNLGLSENISGTVILIR